jgi:hypothetical protein
MSIDELLKNILSKIENMDNKIEGIESQQKENTQILKTLEHASQVHKAELDKLNIQGSEIKGGLVKFKNETSDKLD